MIFDDLKMYYAGIIGNNEGIGVEYYVADSSTSKLHKVTLFCRFPLSSYHFAEDYIDSELSGNKSHTHSSTSDLRYY